MGVLTTVLRVALEGRKISTSAPFLLPEQLISVSGLNCDPPCPHLFSSSGLFLSSSGPILPGYLQSKHLQFISRKVDFGERQRKDIDASLLPFFSEELLVTRSPQ